MHTVNIVWAGGLSSAEVVWQTISLEMAYKRVSLWGHIL